MLISASTSMKYMRTCCFSFIAIEILWSKCRYFGALSFLFVFGVMFSFFSMSHIAYLLSLRIKLCLLLDGLVLLMYSAVFFCLLTISLGKLSILKTYREKKMYRLSFYLLFLCLFRRMFYHQVAYMFISIRVSNYL